jgi:hypothetical protein
MFAATNSAAEYQWMKNGVNITGANSSANNTGYDHNAITAQFSVVVSSSAA